MPITLFTHLWQRLRYTATRPAVAALDAHNHVLLLALVAATSTFLRPALQFRNVIKLNIPRPGLCCFPPSARAGAIPVLRLLEHPKRVSRTHKHQAREVGVPKNAADRRTCFRNGVHPRYQASRVCTLCTRMGTAKKRCATAKRAEWQIWSVARISKMFESRSRGSPLSTPGALRLGIRGVETLLLSGQTAKGVSTDYSRGY
jgi:hypothetical protein